MPCIPRRRRFASFSTDRIARHCRPLHVEPLEMRAMLSGVEVDVPIVELNGIAYFPGRTDNGDFHLWRSDGTVAGTYQVNSVHVFTANGDPHYMTNVNGTLFFVGTDAAHGPEIWKSDGTDAGTKIVSDVRPGMGGSYPAGLTAVGSTLFFDAFDGANRNLWKSDGTAAGTVLVKDVYVGGSEPYMTNANGTLFFKGNESASGDELWKSDGTTAGTVLVKDIRPGSGFSSPAFITNIGGVVYFSATNGSSGYELWRSDGTDAGTVMLKDIAAGSSSSSPRYLKAIGGKLFFSADDAAHGSEPWISDGTAAGTQLVLDVRAGSFGSGPGDFANENGAVLFSDVSTGGLGELWTTDGTSAGTALVKAPLAGNTIGQGPAYLTNVNGTIFFVVQGNVSGEQLWKTDGTPNGTVALKTLPPTDGYSYPEQFTKVGSRLFFSHKDNAGRPVLWTSDGTTSGTVLINLSGNTNQAPVAMDDPINLVEDAPMLIADPPGVLVNDTDADGDPLMAFLNTLPAHGTLTFGSAGNFAYQPDSDFFGTDQFTYHASDGKDSSNVATVTINVAPINDPPTFTIGPDQSATDDAGPQTIDGWCLDASPGPTNEAGQKLTFQATANHPTLFAVQPQINASGQLTFTPALNAMGDATIIVVLQDDGGTANGGINHSAPQTFTIHVTKLAPWQNSVNPLDVDGDTKVTPNDPLLVINYVNSFGAHALQPNGPPPPPPYYDVDGDNSVSPSDALIVIDAINSFVGGQGESTGGDEAALANAARSRPVLTVGSEDFAALLTALASDIASQGNPRRRSV